MAATFNDLQEGGSHEQFSKNNLLVLGKVILAKMKKKRKLMRNLACCSLNPVISNRLSIRHVLFLYLTTDHVLWLYIDA